MVVLKKLKASTLMETMVATVLIVIIFMVASLTLNNVFGNSIKFNTTEIETHLNKLEYQYQHDLLELPYEEVHNNWTITISAAGDVSLVLEASHVETRRRIKRSISL